MLANKEFATYGSQFILPEYFEDPGLGFIFSIVRDCVIDYKETPSVDVIVEEMAIRADAHDENAVSSAISLVESNQIFPSEEDKPYIIDKVVPFLKKMEWKKVILESPALYQLDQFEELDKRWQEARTRLEFTQGTGTNYAEGIEKRITKSPEAHRIYTSGLGALDEVLRYGGLSTKRLYCLVAEGGQGKSMWLKDLAELNVLANNESIVYYTLEMPEEEVAERIDTSLGLNELAYIEYPKETKLLMDQIKTIFDNKLIIKEFPSMGVSIKELRAHYSSLKVKGMAPRLVLIDYAALLKHDFRGMEEYSAIGKIFAQLHGWCTEDDICIVTAAQANREGLGLKNKTVKHVGKSLEIYHHVDCLLMLDQTDEEYKQNKARITILKQRGGRKFLTFDFDTNFGHTQLFKRGHG